MTEKCSGSMQILKRAEKRKSVFHIPFPKELQKFVEMPDAIAISTSSDFSLATVQEKNSRPKSSFFCLQLLDLFIGISAGIFLSRHVSTSGQVP